MIIIVVNNIKHQGYSLMLLLIKFHNMKIYIEIWNLLLYTMNNRNEKFIQRGLHKWN